MSLNPFKRINKYFISAKIFVRVVSDRVSLLPLKVQLFIISLCFTTLTPVFLFIMHDASGDFGLKGFLADLIFFIGLHPAIPVFLSLVLSGLVLIIFTGLPKSLSYCEIGTHITNNLNFHRDRCHKIFSEFDKEAE